MRQEFEMTPEEMKDIQEIAKGRPAIMLQIPSGMSQQEQANNYWETMGKKYGFKHMSVEQSSRGNLFFLAEPCPKEVPKTELELAIEKYDTIEKIVEQLEFCKYQNEAGPLELNIAFIALKKMI